MNKLITLYRNFPPFRYLYQRRIERESLFYEQNRIFVLRSYRYLLRTVPKLYQREMQQVTMYHQITHLFRNSKDLYNIHEVKRRSQHLASMVDDIKKGDLSNIGAYVISRYGESVHMFMSRENFDTYNIEFNIQMQGQMQGARNADKRQGYKGGQANLKLLGNSVQLKPEGHQHQIHEDSSMLEYFSYLRNITQCNQMPYWIGNPSVQIINGTISLKPLQTTYLREPQTLEEYIALLQKTNLHRSSTTSRCLALCGIPNSKSPVEVIETSSIERFRNCLVEMRVVKTTHLKYYAILLLVKDELSAQNLFSDLFGTLYNQIENQRIILRQMMDITLSFSGLKDLKDTDESGLRLLRKLSDDFNERLSPENVFMSLHRMRVGTQLFCAICQTQTSTQVISILCGHYFNWECLQKWTQNTCPLCRYHQQPPVIKYCQVCNQCDGLWVCLICGVRLCCGTENDILANDSHIYTHYKQTNHGLAMEVQTKFIFDARVPAFLHQMFYKELISKTQQEINAHRKTEERAKKNKISEKIAEYEKQVTEEMKKQRKYFEDSLRAINKQNRAVIAEKRQHFKALKREFEGLGQEIGRMEGEKEQKRKRIEELEKQDKKLSDLKGFYQRKAEEMNNRTTERQQKEKALERELEKQIEQKREELRNYRENISIGNRLKKQLKNEKVEESVMLLTKGKKAKK